MRFVFVGAGSLAVATAKALIERGLQVIIIEIDKERIDELGEVLDCSFLHGNGSKPEILRDISPEKDDVLFTLSNNDQDNIVAALAGRSLGFQRIIPRINDPQFEIICQELKLDNYIVPNRTIACHLSDMASGDDRLDMSSAIKGDARLFSWTLNANEAAEVKDLALPPEARLICVYRDKNLVFVEEDTVLKEHDEIIVLCHRDVLQDLKEHFNHDDD